MQPAQSSPEGLKTCRKHGLSYDPTKGPGCVLCRKEAAYRPQDTGLSPGVIAGGALLLAGLALAFLVPAFRTFGRPSNGGVEAGGAPPAPLTAAAEPIEPDPPNPGGLLDECEQEKPEACRKLAGLLPPTQRERIDALYAYAADLDRCIAEGRASCADVKKPGERMGQQPAPRVAKPAEHETSCEEGVLVSCWEAVEAYSTAAGQRDDKRVAGLQTKARELLRKGCGDGKPCVNAEVEKLLDGCDHGDGFACAEAARSSKQAATAFAVLFRRGARLLEGECDRMRAVSCRRAAELRATGDGGLSHDDEKVTGLYQKGCLSGDGHSCLSVAHAQEAGKGVPKSAFAAERSYRKAAELLTPLCETGDKGACGEVATLYEEAKGVPRDEALAAKYRGLAKK